MARRKNPTSITLPDELHRRLKHLCVDRNIRQTQAINEALENYLREGGEGQGKMDAPTLGLQSDETLLMRLEEAGHAIDVLQSFVTELSHAAASRISEDTINGGSGQEEGSDRGAVAGSGGGTGEAKAS